MANNNFTLQNPFGTNVNQTYLPYGQQPSSSKSESNLTNPTIPSNWKVGQPMDWSGYDDSSLFNIHQSQTNLLTDYSKPQWLSGQQKGYDEGLHGSTTGELRNRGYDVDSWGDMSFLEAITPFLMAAFPMYSAIAGAGTVGAGVGMGAGAGSGTTFPGLSRWSSGAGVGGGMGGVGASTAASAAPAAGNSAGLLSGSIPSYTPAQNLVAGVQGGYSSMAPASAGGGFLSEAGNFLSGLNKGSLGANVKAYAPVVIAGVEYANAKAAQESLEQMIAASDPFGPERAKYQQQLDELMRNPEAFMSGPQATSAADAAARKMAAMGFNLSPNQAAEISNASMGAYNDQVNLLSGLAGSAIPPSSLGTSAPSVYNSSMKTTGAGGDFIRTLSDSIFGTSDKNNKNSSFSYLDGLV